MSSESPQIDWRPSFELMLAEARRSLDGQVEVIGQTRGRAVELAGFGSLLAAALGFGAETGDVNGWQWAGIASFGVALAAAIFVLSPREFHFALLATKIDAWFDRPDNFGNDHMLYSAAKAHEANYQFNKRKIVWMQAGIFWAMLALAAEAMLLVLSLVLS